MCHPSFSGPNSLLLDVLIYIIMCLRGNLKVEVRLKCGLKAVNKLGENK